MIERLRGWRTIIVAGLMAGLGGALGVAVHLDWAPILQAYLPTVPPWAVLILAGFVMGVLRDITDGPPAYRKRDGDDR